MLKKILVLGTNNRHKLIEITPLLEGAGVELRSAGEYGAFAPEETGTTLEENAILKARAAMELSKEWAFADDTGLEVDALGGRPGLFAARYAGPGCTFEDNIRKLLGELQNCPAGQRQARFTCVIALCRPAAEPMTFRASCAGHILTEPRGTGGFGYDPVFWVEEAGKSFAELTLAEKNRLSHRARAVRMLRAEWVNLLLQEEALQRAAFPPANP